MAVNFIDPNPATGNQFGHSVVALTNGNVVVTSPFDDAGGFNAGAVYLFNGSTGALISTLRGSTDFDLIGREGVIPLSNGNFLVSSSSWHNSNGHLVGAVTFGNGASGVSGVVSATNSLVGSMAGDSVGATGSVVALPSGNYVMLTPSWDNGASTDSGAITWGNGSTGTLGTISSTNSLVGIGTGDRVGGNGAKVLSSGNYVVISSSWSASMGAVTWASGTAPITGTVSAANSLVGSSAGDEVGSRGILQLTNGNYVVLSPNWDNAGIPNVGAATWVNGTVGLSGTLNAANSLVGSTAEDNVGGNLGAALINGNYVISVPSWDNGGNINAGAAVWGSGTAGVKGTISSANAFVGARSNDQVSISGVFPLTNGNYVVNSPGVGIGSNSQVGAVTWGNGVSGLTGVVSAANSLVGSLTNDLIGVHGIAALSNGNYTVASGNWDNGVLIDAGAVTWGNGTGGTVGAVSTSNSMVGARGNDFVGFAGVTPLTNGNYIFGSPAWNNGTAVVGAVTWRDGSSASSGTVSAANSLVGSTAIDRVGDIGSMKALSNGNYVALTSNWDNGSAADAGAVTWGNGTTGITGPITAANSLVGTVAGDTVGNNGIVQLANGNFVVVSTSWDSAGVANVGAVTWVNGGTGRVGAVSASNSLVGSTAEDQVGLNGITPLSNGNYVVNSALFNAPGQNDVGAVTWASGSAGIAGTINAPSVNHAKGSSVSSDLKTITLDAVNGNFFARFINEGSGTIRIGSQSSGFDVPTVGTLTAAFSGPNLTISDLDSTGKDNFLTVSRVNVSGTDYFEFTDPVEAFTTVPITIPASTLTNNNHTLRVPASVITGSLTVSLAGGNDTLQLELTSGDVVPSGGVFFNGGNPTAGAADKLIISGGAQGNVSYSYTNASDGSVLMTNFGTVNYTGLEQALTNTGTSTDVVVSLPTASANSVTLADDANSGNGRSRISGSTILTTEFSNPAGGLTLNYGNANDAVTFNAMPDYSGSLVLGTAVFPFSSVTFAGPLNLAADKNVAVFASGTINLSTANSDLSLTGTGTMLLSSARNINLASGSSITTASGSLTLDANQQSPATAGNFTGVLLTGARLQSASGAINVRGRGGSDGSGSQYGVRLLTGAEVGSGTTGVVTVQGTGGASTGGNNYGVQVSGFNSQVTSGGGNVFVTGTGGGTGSSTGNVGVSIEANGVVRAGSAGIVTVTGSGGSTTGANAGVVVTGTGSQITSGSGAVSVSGTATGGLTFAPGVLVSSAGSITSGSTANVTVNGTSNATGGNSFGVNVNGPGSQITSAGGNVSVTGLGGGSATATQGYGVYVENVGKIAAGGAGTVTVNGTGRNTSGTGSLNHGVVISDSGQVTSSGGNVSVVGAGGGGSTTTSNIGVLLQNSGLVTAVGSAAIAITGTGGTGSSGTANHGVSLVDVGTQITAGNGGLTITGTPGPHVSSMGLELNNSATIADNSTGNIELIADRMRILSTVTADLTKIIVRPKTASRPIDVGTADSLTALGLDDAELDRLAASVVQIGSATSGNITATAAITSPNSLLVLTGGELSIQNAFTMATDKNFNATAGSTVRLPNLVSNLSTGGSGVVNITTPRNILLSNGSRITTTEGNLTLAANQQAVSTAAAFIGIELNGSILTSSTGQIQLMGRGGAIDGNSNLHGIVFGGTNAQINTGAGVIQLIGTGGGIGTSHTNYGVMISNAARIQPGVGSANIQGQGGNTTGSGANNHGVVLNNGLLSGATTMTGRGGGGTSSDNYGVTSTSLQTAAVGNLNATGFGGGLLGGGNNNHGISLNRLVGTDVQLTGTGGGAAASASNYGINFVTDGAGGSFKTLVATGYGGNLTGTGGDNRGFSIAGETSLITTNSMSITGVGGGGVTTGSNTGVSLSPFFVRATDAGLININGTGGAAAAGNSSGVFIGVQELTAANGSINISAAAAATQPAALRVLVSSLIRSIGAAGGVALTANGMELATTATINAGTNAVTIKPLTAGTPIDLGGADVPGTLAVTDAELDRITAGTIQFGDNTAGAMTVSQPITRAAATAVSLNSGGAINFTTGSLATANGNVTLNPNSAFTPATSGVDINAGSGTISFGAGDDLVLNISGFAVDNQHQQLNAAGVVNVSGADLITVGNLTASGGEVIRILDNDGTDPVVGTFAGLSEGALVATNFLNSGLSATISYVGGTGNDVVIVMGNPAGTTSVAVTNGDLVITDIAGGNTDDTLTISRNGVNIRISDPNNILTADAGAIFVDIHTIDVPVASITGTLLIDTLDGSDSVTLNFADGSVIPAGGVLYLGGNGASDSLAVTAGATSTADHGISDSSEGFIALTGAIAGTIAYEGVEPIVDSLIVANRSFSLFAGAETIDVSDAIGAFNLLNSSLGHAVTFANPTATLAIDAAIGSDTININSLDVEGPFAAALTISGGDGDDVLNLNADITFAADHSLDLDLQNDAASPGIDTINIGPGANLVLAGSGSATLKASRNISFAAGSSVVTANGTILVEANQQTVATAGDFVGVQLNGGIVQSTGAGVVTVRGRGGDGSGGLQIGTLVTGSGAIRGGTTGTTVVQGTGGAGTGNQNYGVRVFGAGSIIASLGANVQVTGAGGGTGATSGANRGIDIESDGPGTASIAAGGAGNVIVNGTGSNTRVSPGVRVAGIGGLITSATGTVQVTGQAGNGNLSFATGVWVDAGTITSGIGGGSVTVSGLGASAPNGGNYGVYVTSVVAKTGLITSGGGALQVIGQGGSGAAGANLGVFVATGGEITAPADNPLTITGTGGQGANGSNMGVVIVGRLNSVDQNVTVLGTGGEGTGSYGIGIDQATVTVGDIANLRLQATSTVAGVVAFVAGHPSTSTTISHTGTGRIEIAADTILIESTATITNSLGIVSFSSTTPGRNINLGSNVDTAANTLEMSDAELDRVTANTLQIGDPNSGPIILSSPITRSAATIINVDSAAAINFTGGSLSSAGGNIRLNAGTNIVPTTAGLDVGPGASGILRFGIGDRLTLNLGGPVVDSQYNQLNVAGQVDLTAVQLVLTGPMPALGDGFIIVSNDGNDPVIGTFDGLPEGTMVDVNGMSKRLTYVGGDGNDVVLLAGNSSPTIDPLSDIPLNEDAPQQIVNLTGITAGIESQSILVTATSALPTLIPTPTITYSSPNPTGTLSFTPAANQFGTTTINVIVRDAGQDGFFNTADDAVTTTSFQVTIAPINDPPTFNTLGNQGVVFNSGPQTVAGWASSIQPGPSNESGQSVTFSVTNVSNPGLFIAQPVISANGTLTYSPQPGISGSATITYIAQDNGGTANGGVDATSPQTFVITIGPELTLRVISVTPTSTGFVALFNRPLDLTAISLYDTQGGGFGPADIVLQRAGAALPIRGSVVADSTATQLTFVATTGLLPADDYTVTLRAAANGVVDTLGTVLDGNLDSIPGGDYVQTFSITQNPAAVTVSIPNFARGPRQDVNLPSGATTGIPISFSNGEGLLSASFQIHYNPALLEITDALAVTSLPGTFATAFISSPGVLEVSFTSNDPLPAGTTHFMNLLATVPADANYAAKQVLDIRSIQLSNNVPAIDDDGVAVVAFFGDVSGNGTYSAQDASYIARLGLGIDTGLADYQLLDPVIVGDITGNGAFSATDTSLMLRAAVGIAVPEIPTPLPSGSLLFGGPDPKLSIPRNLNAVPGQSLSIPIDIDSIVNLTGNGLASADLVLYYDPAVLDVTEAGLGQLVANRTGWMISSHIDPIAGRIDISVAGSRPIEGTFIGELVQLKATIRTNAPAGGSAINLAATSRSRSTQLNEGFLTLIPAPTDSPHDAIDGLITVTPTSPNTAGPSARLENNRLLITGTSGNDLLLVTPTTDGTQLFVRANNRILGRFDMPLGIAIDGYSGQDRVYVDPAAPPTVIATAAADSLHGIAEDLIFTGENADLVDSPGMPTTSGSAGASQPLSYHDLALLQLLDQYIADQADGMASGGSVRRRR